MPKSGWAAARLNDVCELLNGRAYKQSELLQNGKYRVLRVGNFFSNPHWYYSDLELDEDKYCYNGDLLYAWSASFGPRIWHGEKTIFHYHIWRVLNDARLADRSFLYRWFAWDKENIKADHGTGSTMIHVTKGDMEKRTISLPPLAEQRRIVAKLDALTARTARARADLDRVPTLVARYKHTILKKAFSGELTASWRASQKSNQCPIEPRCEEDIRPKFRAGGLGGAFAPPYDLPSAWRWLRLPEIGDMDRGKSRHRPRDDSRLFGGPFPFVQTGEVRAADRYLTTYSKTYSAFGLEQSRLWPRRTVCITIAANIAETAILDIEACFPDSVVGLSADARRCLPEYVEYFIRTSKAELAQFAPATAQKNINLDVLGNVRVPVAPLAEQTEIVRRVDSAFTEIDRLTGEAAAARLLLDRLDQAILAKAFRGELVPQDPTDEPASVLLERIRAERAAAPAKARRRRKGEPA